LPPSLIAWSLRLLVILGKNEKKGSCRESRHESHDKVKASEKKDTESSLGLVKNRQTTKTFNKGKKIVWGKECPSNSSSGIYI
jgi:hypothetical protein